MPSEWLTNMTVDWGIIWGIDPVNMLYFMALFFSVFIAISLGVASKSVWVGLIAFFGTLFVFTFLDAFPLWILVIPIVIAMFIGFYALRGGGMSE